MHFSSFLFNSERLYRAYIIRLVLLMIVSGLEFSCFLVIVFPILASNLLLKCDIGEFSYECAGHPGQFYLYIGKLLASNLLNQLFG